MLIQTKATANLLHKFETTQQTCNKCDATFIVFHAVRRNNANKMKAELVTFCPICGVGNEKAKSTRSRAKSKGDVTLSERSEE